MHSTLLLVIDAVTEQDTGARIGEPTEILGTSLLRHEVQLDILNTLENALEMIQQSLIVDNGAGADTPIQFCSAAITLCNFIDDHEDPLMYTLGSTDLILPYAKSYASYILAAVPAMVGAFSLNNIRNTESL